MSTNENDRPSAVRHFLAAAGIPDNGADRFMSGCRELCAPGRDRRRFDRHPPFGILEFDRTTASKDPTSSVGARLFRGQKLRISQQTDRIPIRQGLSYGVAFIVKGTPPGAVAEVKVILRSSSPCLLKETREVVHHNDSVLQVRIGELRHIGGMIASGDDNHCVDTPGPGTETFELHYGGRKLAEKSFHLFIE